MKIILHSILKRKTIETIEELGRGICEIIVDIDLSFGTCNSIEYNIDEYKLYLHFFEDDYYDLVCDFDDIDESDKINILVKLKAI
jgi:hypothetical protein